MAHTVTSQTLVDGSRNTIIKVNIKGDALTATELVDYVIYDASASESAATSNKLMEIEFCLNGFSAELFWDATSNVPLISLDKDISEDKEYWSFGGLINNAGSGKTGDILITTTGLASTANDGYIIFYLKQREISVIR